MYRFVMKRTVNAVIKNSNNKHPAKNNICVKIIEYKKNVHIFFYGLSALFRFCVEKRC